MANSDQLILEYLDTVQRIVGQFVDGLLISAFIVVKKSLHIKASTRNTVAWSVAIVITNSVSRDTIVIYGRVAKQMIIRYYGLIASFVNGVNRYLKEMIILAKSVVLNVRKVIGLRYTHTILNRYQSTRNLPMKLVMESLYAKIATTIFTIPKYCDVIRKRYRKFVNDNDETGWEEATPNVLSELPKQ